VQAGEEEQGEGDDEEEEQKVAARGSHFKFLDSTVLSLANDAKVELHKR
jgi:hypothetical protein